MAHFRLLLPSQVVAFRGADIKLEAATGVNLPVPILPRLYAPAAYCTRTQVNPNGSFDVDLLLPRVDAGAGDVASATATASPAAAADGAAPYTHDSIATVSIGRGRASVVLVEPLDAGAQVMTVGFAPEKSEGPAGPRSFVLSIGTSLATRVVVEAETATVRARKRCAAGPSAWSSLYQSSSPRLLTRTGVGAAAAAAAPPGRW